MRTEVLCAFQLMNPPFCFFQKIDNAFRDTHTCNFHCCSKSLLLSLYANLMYSKFRLDLRMLNLP